MGTATDYGLDDRGIGVPVAVGSGISLHIVRTGSEAHAASYKMCTGRSFPGVKPTEREDYHSHPTSAEASTYAFTA